MVPEPIPASLWESVSGNLRNNRSSLLSVVDESKDPLLSLSRRAKQPSTGGEMTIYSSRSGGRRTIKPRDVVNDAVAQVGGHAEPGGTMGER